VGIRDYSGGPTDWERYELPQLVAFLSEDLGQASTHAAAWYRTAAMADSYRAALQRIRDGLAGVWSPQHSPAAVMYLGRLDSMITSLVDLHEAALANGEALNGVLTTLQGARRRVEQLHNEWVTNESLIQQPEYSTGLEPWRAPLNQQAWQHMRETDNAVYAYLPRMVKPKPWRPGATVDPPPTPLDGSGGPTGSAASGPAGGRSARPPVVPPVYLPDDSAVPSPQSGAIPPTGGPVLTGGPALGGDVGVTGRGAGVGGGAAGGGLGSGSSGSWMVDTPHGRVMRSGAVIGIPPEPGSGLPGSPEGAASARTPGARSPSRPSSGLPAEPTGAGERGTAGLMGGIGGVGGRSGQQRRRCGSEPYVVWEVREGVPPVIEPGPEPVHEPGPGVIGIDR
jgi:hypothetical protein